MTKGVFTVKGAMVAKLTATATAVVLTTSLTGATTFAASHNPVVPTVQSVINQSVQGYLHSHGPVAPGHYAAVGGHAIASASTFAGHFANTSHIPASLLPQNPQYYVVKGQVIDGRWQYPFAPVGGSGTNMAWLEVGINNTSHQALYEVGTIDPTALGTTTTRPGTTATHAAMTSATSYNTNVAWGLTARWDGVGNPIFAVLDQVTWHWDGQIATDVPNNITNATWNAIPYYYYDFFHNIKTYSSGGYYQGSAAWFSWPDDFDYWSPINNSQSTNLVANWAVATTTGTVHNPESGATIQVTSKIHGSADGNYWYTASSPCTGSICGLLNSPNVYYGLSSGYVLA